MVFLVIGKEPNSIKAEFHIKPTLSQPHIRHARHQHHIESVCELPSANHVTLTFGYTSSGSRRAA
jgi:hypothetical protein